MTTQASRNPSSTTVGGSGTEKPAAPSAGSVARAERLLRRQMKARAVKAAEPMSTQTPIRYRLVIPALPVGPNGPGGLLRMHWAKRSRYNTDWQWLVKWALGNVALLEPPPNRQAEVRIIQVRKRLMDPDNATAACKAILDACVYWGLLYGDDPEHLALIVDQERAQGREPQTIVEIRW